MAQLPDDMDGYVSADTKNLASQATLFWIT